MVSLTLLAAVFAGALSGATWQVETVDKGATGKFSSLRFDKDGNGHVAYVAEEENFALKYGFWDRTLKRWFTMTVAQSASFTSLALDSKQRPHISYADAGGVKGAKLRYAYWDGTAWKYQAIDIHADVIGYYTSITLDLQDRPHISFYEYEGPGGTGFALRVRVAHWNGKYWELRTVDGDKGSGKFNFITIDSAGNPHVVYANVGYVLAGLRYGRWNAERERWDLEILEGTTISDPVYSVSVTLDKQDVPHIAYTNLTKHLVKYATRADGKWRLEVVDTLGHEAYPDRNGIALDEEGNPCISYYDAGFGVLKVACRKNQKWVAEVVDQNFAGFTSSLQIASGTMWISYADETNRTFKIARRSLTEEKAAPESSLTQEKQTGPNLP